MHSTGSQWPWLGAWALLVAALAPAAAPAAGPVVPAGETQRIAEGVHVIPDKRRDLVPNIGIIVGSEAVMVVDTGMGPKNARTVLEEVRAITDKPIRYLAITHFHPEHGMGAQAFPETTAVLVPRAQAEELADKGEAYIEMFEGFGPEVARYLEDIRPPPPDIAFERRVQVDLGDRRVEVFYLHPAHTRGDAYVWLPAERILFAGDIVLNRFFPIMPDADSSGLGWLEALERLAAMEPAIVVPGHGATGDTGLIDALSEFLQRMQQEVAARKAQGLGLEQIQAELGPALRERYARWDNPHWVDDAIARFYAEL